MRSILELFIFVVVDIVGAVLAVLADAHFSVPLFRVEGDHAVEAGEHGFF